MNKNVQLLCSNIWGYKFLKISYKKLWKLLIDRDLRKKDLESMANISHFTMYKLSHGQNVTTDCICRICEALDVSIEDILELVDE